MQNVHTGICLGKSSAPASFLAVTCFSLLPCSCSDKTCVFFHSQWGVSADPCRTLLYILPYHHWLPLCCNDSGPDWSVGTPFSATVSMKLVTYICKLTDVLKTGLEYIPFNITHLMSIRLPIEFFVCLWRNVHGCNEYWAELPER